MSLLRRPLAWLLRLTLGRRRPIRSGRLSVAGPHEEIEIGRDEYGVPSVTANNEEDVWFGLGFCQGQDRSFQLDTLVRAARGRLAELAGPEMLPVDRLTRRVGFVRSARRQLSRTDPGTGLALEAFARGVRAGRSAGRSEPAHGFTLSGVEPLRFEPADVLALLELTSFTLPTNWDAELARLLVWSEDGPEALRDLDPVWEDARAADRAERAAGTPPGILSGAQIQRLEEELEQFREQVARGGGSNAWAVSADRAAGGRPILANDPHLAPQLPAHWYLARCETPGWTAVGAALVGTPAITSGHNGHLAWGLTAGMVDNTDLFLERLDESGRRCRSDGEWREVERRTERIEVRGGDPVEEVVRSTERGPIITPLTAEDRSPYALSVRATYLEDVPVGPFYRIHGARSPSEFRAAFRDWPFLSLRMVYVHEEGAIGAQLVGSAPRRRAGTGLLPQPGWSGRGAWKSTVGTEGLPGRSDPVDGIVVAANDRPAGANGSDLGRDWMDPYRADRIADRLRARRDWTPEAFVALQRDLHSPVWEELREDLLDLRVSEADAVRALRLLEDWDGEVSEDSAAAAVFELFLAEMTTRVVRRRAPRSARWALGEGFHPMLPHTILAVRRVGHLVHLLEARPEGWFDRPWKRVVEEALARALNRVRDRAGGEEAEWGWGRLRTMKLEHPLGRRPLLGALYDRGPIPCGGDANTICQGSVYPGEPFGQPLFTPSLRTVIEAGAWKESRFVLPGGQSENPLSPHYDDQLALWRRGEALRIPHDAEAARARTQENLHVSPAGNRTSNDSK